MSDLILIHGENGKTFFVDKEEYLAHWEWTKPTKYVDKYEKNGKTVYVYADTGSNSVKRQQRKEASPKTYSYYDKRRGKFVNITNGLKGADRIEKTKNSILSVKEEKIPSGGKIETLSKVRDIDKIVEREEKLSDGGKISYITKEKDTAPISERTHSRKVFKGEGTAHIPTDEEVEAENKIKEIENKRKEIIEQNKKTKRRALRDAKYIAETEGTEKAESIADQVIKSLGLDIGDDRAYRSEYKSIIVKNLKDQFIDEKYKSFEEYIENGVEQANSEGNVYEWAFD